MAIHEGYFRIVRIFIVCKCRSKPFKFAHNHHRTSLLEVTLILQGYGDPSLPTFFFFNFYSFKIYVHLKANFKLHFIVSKHVFNIKLEFKFNFNLKFHFKCIFILKLTFFHFEMQFQFFRADQRYEPRIRVDTDGLR